jgi:hypothetical protein
LYEVKLELRKTFLSHEYLGRSKKLTKDNIQEFRQYINSQECQNLTPKDVSAVLQNLCRFLYKHFGKKSYVLMDEYDAAINHSYLKLKDQES